MYLSKVRSPRGQGMLYYCQTASHIVEGEPPCADVSSSRLAFSQGSDCQSR